MKERPILFSGPMVRAILKGRKTQTRRVMKPQPRGIWGSGVAMPGNLLGVRSDAFHVHCNVDGDHRFLYCPCGQPGDRLWIRETWSPDARNAYPCPEFVYRATDPEYTEHAKDCRERYESKQTALKTQDKHAPEGCLCSFRWHPSIHMPRLASRLTLEITGVRVERLQEISHEDAVAEGVHEHGPFPLKEKRMSLHCHAFADLWDSLAKPGVTWADNPWVWVIEFKRMGASC